MAAGKKYRTLTRTFVLEQSIESVWATLVDPQAAMWLTPDAAYSIAVPASLESLEGVGALRAGWQDKWKRGIRRFIVWELLRVVEHGHVTFLDRSRPKRHFRLDFRLTAEQAGTAVDLVFQWNPTLVDRLLLGAQSRQYANFLEQQFREAAQGRIPKAVNAHAMTMSAGRSAREQVNTILISASPKRIWALVEDKSANLIADPNRVVAWRSQLDEVEFTFSFARGSAGELTPTMTKVTQNGPFNATTVDSFGIELTYELLPSDDACLLRLTALWTTLIKAKAIRAGHEAWLATVKQIAETPTD